MIKLQDLLVEQADSKFVERANEFLKRLQKMSDKRMERDVPNNPKAKFTFDKSGKRYWRVVVTSGGSRTAHSFLDTTNGDVLKAAGWKAPAKHARSNIFNSDYGMSGIGDYGAKYLR